MSLYGYVRMAVHIILILYILIPHINIIYVHECHESGFLLTKLNSFHIIKHSKPFSKELTKFTYHKSLKTFCIVRVMYLKHTVEMLLKLNEEVMHNHFQLFIWV